MTAKKTLPALLAAVIFLAPAYSGGKKDTADNVVPRPQAYNVFQIRETFPGDPVFLYIEAPEIITKATAGLYTGSGKKVADGDGFSVGSPYTMVIPLALSTYAGHTPLTAKITAVCGHTIHEYVIDVPVQHKQFVSETIPLDNRNTAIRTDRSGKRQTQIKTLNKVLAFRGAGVFTMDPFIQPVDGTPRRSSFFGDRRIFAYSNGEKAESIHHGIDFAVPTGTPVYACGAGKIALAENRLSTGWSIVIEHMPGLYSLYYHLDSISVHKGDLVARGKPIGKSGATGLATGPHLHWEIRLNMHSVNPEFFLQPYIPRRY